MTRDDLEKEIRKRFGGTYGEIEELRITPSMLIDVIDMLGLLTKEELPKYVQYSMPRCPVCDARPNQPCEVVPNGMHQARRDLGFMHEVSDLEDRIECLEQKVDADARR